MKQKSRKITLHGVTAPIEAFHSIGLRFYENSNQLTSDTSYYLVNALPGYMARAKDELPDASGERVVNRVATIISRDKLTTAIQTLGEGLKKGINGHVNVAHDVRPALRQLLAELPQNAG